MICYKNKITIFAKGIQKTCIMSEQELNSYRFTSGQEPSDEMLAQIMREVAQEAAESNKKAIDAHFEQMKKNIAVKQAIWAERINKVINDRQ